MKQAAGCHMYGLWPAADRPQKLNCVCVDVLELLCQSYICVSFVWILKQGLQ